jgi:hypothetical protein
MNPEDVKAGTCFLLKSRYSPCEHLYIVLAIDCEGWDPNECIIVNLTESQDGNKALSFHVGDHPYITKKSDVNFGDMEVSTRAAVAIQVNAGTTFPPLDPLKVRLIGITAKTHPAVMERIKKVLAKKYLGIIPVSPAPIPPP